MFNFELFFFFRTIELTSQSYFRAHNEYFVTGLVEIRSLYTKILRKLCFAILITFVLDSFYNAE